jgi:hypothetical protein
MKFRWLLLFCCACSEAQSDAGLPVDLGTPDLGSADLGPSDSGADAGVVVDASDSGGMDAEPTDLTSADAEPTDLGSTPPLDCSGSTLPPRPSDTSLPGPWPVGARTATVAGLTVEFWYPATPGSEANSATISYDIRDVLPASERTKIPDDDNPWQDCHCYRDLPLDPAAGPFPVIVFVHGTAGFRHQSLELVTHWASRGFVVVAADHPGLYMGDLLAGVCVGSFPNNDLEGDVRRLLSALETPTGPTSFLAGKIDLARLGIAGHSAGGRPVAALSDRASVAIPMASGGVSAGANLRASVVMAAERDGIVMYSRTKTAYEATPGPKRFLGLAGAGHLAFSSMCSLRNPQGQGLVEIAEEHGVCGTAAASFLFDCDPTFLSDPIGWSIIQEASTAVLETVLQCTDRSGIFQDLSTRRPQILELLQAP